MTLIGDIAYSAFEQAKKRGFNITEANAAEAVSRQLKNVLLNSNSVFNSTQKIDCEEFITITDHFGGLCRNFNFKFHIDTYMVSRMDMILLDGRLENYSTREPQDHLLDNVMTYIPNSSKNGLTVSYGELTGHRVYRDKLTNPVYIRPNDLLVVSHVFGMEHMKASIRTVDYSSNSNFKDLYKGGNNANTPKRLHPVFDVYFPGKNESTWFGLSTRNVPDLDALPTGFEFSFNKTDRRYTYSFSENISPNIIKTLMDNSTTFNPNKVDKLSCC